MKRIIQGTIALAIIVLSTVTGRTHNTNEFRIISIGPNEQGNLTITWHSRPNDVFTV